MSKSAHASCRKCVVTAGQETPPAGEPAAVARAVADLKWRKQIDDNGVVVGAFAVHSDVNAPSPLPAPRKACLTNMSPHLWATVVMPPWVAGISRVKVTFYLVPAADLGRTDWSYYSFQEARLAHKARRYAEHRQQAALEAEAAVLER